LHGDSCLFVDFATLDEGKSGRVPAFPRSRVPAFSVYGRPHAIGSNGIDGLREMRRGAGMPAKNGKKECVQIGLVWFGLAWLG